MEDKKKLPGDEGYLGGTVHTTVRINGKVYDVETQKDANGNPTVVSTTPKIWGLF